MEFEMSDEFNYWLAEQKSKRNEASEFRQLERVDSLADRSAIDCPRCKLPCDSYAEDGRVFLVCSVCGWSKDQREVVALPEIPRKYTRLLNKKTGEVLNVDREAGRISRMRKRVKGWSELLKQFPHYVMKMCTLTYAPENDWEANHVRDFMLDLRKFCGDALIAYAWVAELQQRGAVHYHVLIVLKYNLYIPKLDQEKIWEYGWTRVEVARTPFYILKYTQKALHDGKQFPKGLRLFSVWVSAKEFLSEVRRVFRLSSLPQWLVALVESMSDFPKRVAGGGWSCEDQFFQSPYEKIF